MTERIPRKLAAILYADVAGYSRLTGEDEDATHRALSDYLDLISKTIEEHRGEVMHYAGDAVLAKFDAVVDALSSAVAIQNALTLRNQELPEDRKVRFRIGINLGDVIEDRGDIYGDGVNVAARLEALAEPGGICISGTVYDAIGDKLGLGYESMGEQQVKNISTPVRAFRVLLAGDRTVALPRGARQKRRAWGIVVGVFVVLVIGVAMGWHWTRQDPLLELPKGPRIAVMPFANLSGDADQYFSDGLTEDIVTELSRFSDLFVISRQTTKELKDEAVDCREIGRALGADYILEGTVRRSQDDLRVTGRLVDAKDCEQLWSESYDRKLTAADIFSVQDEITDLVVGSIGSAPRWSSKRQQELREKRTDSLEAYECVLLADWFYETFSPEDHKRARDCLEHAVELDPGYSMAQSKLAWMYVEEEKYGYNLRPEPLTRALDRAQTAIELDPQNENAYLVLAMIRYMTETNFDSFHALAEQAIAINPNNASVLADLGAWTAYSGDFERGKALLHKAMLLNPLHQRWLHFPFVLDHYRKGEYRDALAVALKMNLPQNYMAQTALAAVYGQLGEHEKAKATIDHILTIHPPFADDPRAPFVKRRMPAELVESLMDGLRKAGFEVPPENE